MLACQLARRGGDPAPPLPPLQPRSCAIGAPECACTRGVRWCEQTVSAQRSWRGAADALPRQARRCARRVRLAQLRLPAAAPHGPAAAARKCDPDTRRGRTRAEGRGHPRRCALAPTRPARGGIPRPSRLPRIVLPRTGSYGCHARAARRTQSPAPERGAPEGRRLAARSAAREAHRIAEAPGWAMPSPRDTMPHTRLLCDTGLPRYPRRRFT
jgi:hypothetical protein